MLKLKKVAVTGSLASGKTTICSIFKELGAYVVSADEIVHKLLSFNTAISRRIINLLGSDIVDSTGINRKKIADKVFSDPHKLRLLEQILHPAVLYDIQEQYEEVKDNPAYTLFVAEVPLLYESESEKYFDAVVAVVADPALCSERFSKSSRRPLEEYEKRMNMQMPAKEKAARADFIIDNSKNIQSLKPQIQAILKEL